MLGPAPDGKLRHRGRPAAYGAIRVTVGRRPGSGRLYGLAATIRLHVPAGTPTAPR
jgi:hypothetical protein